MVLLKKSIEKTTTESAIPLLEISFFIVDHQGTPSPIPLYMYVLVDLMFMRIPV